MKLYVNPPSPYARKVVVAAHELNLADRLTLVKCDPWSDPQELTAATPLCKVPALVTAGGMLIVESSTICEYLLDQAGKSQADGSGQFEVLARAALAQGLMDAAFDSVIEKRRPEERQWPEWEERQYRAITRTLPTIAVPPEGRFDLGDLSFACALAYLDFRIPDLPWRRVRGDLATWLDSVSDRPSMAASRP